MTAGGAAIAPPPPPPPAPTEQAERCPRCGAVPAPGQRSCLNCGADLSVAYRRAPNWRVWPVVVGVTALAAGAGAGIGISSAIHKKTKHKTIVTSTGTAPAPAAPPAAQAPAPAPTTPPAAPPGTGPLASWPAGTRAYTVVLAAASSQVGANAKAREAQSRGIAAGVLFSDQHPGPKPHSWVVFSGQYANAAAARAQADGVAARGFAGAYPQLIKK